MTFFSKYTTPPEAALDYANRGFPVFPSSFAPESGSKKGKKFPLCAQGFRDATTDCEQIKDWWTSFPNAMIGIPTGLASMLYVIEIDREEGFKNWQKLGEELGFDHEGTICEKSPSGLHYYYKYPVIEGKTPGCTVEKIAAGVNTYGEGGAIIVSPSFYKVEFGFSEASMHHYQALRDSEIQEIPGPLLDHILKFNLIEKANKVKHEELHYLMEVVEKEKEEEDFYKDLAAQKAQEAPQAAQEDEEESKYAEKLPSLPLHALPPKLALAIDGVSRVFCVNHWLPFAAALKTASTAVGANIILEHRQQSPGHTWLCLVGAPSLGKSEITRFFGRPIAEAEKTYCERYATEFAYFSEEMKGWEAAQAAARKKEETFKDKKPEPPVKTSLYVDDVTPESLAWVLSQNPGGVSWDCDEIRALLSSFGRYGGKGSGEAAKARMLSMYSGSPLKIDRKGAEASTFIPSAWLSIFGTVQPSILPKIFEKDDRASGFLQRFMFIKAEGTPPVPTAQRPQLKEFERTVQEIFGGLVEKVERLVPVQDGQDELKERTKPKIIRLEPEAAETLDEFTDTIKKEAFYLGGQGEEAEEAQSRAGRWCDQLPRLILLFHCLKAAEEKNEIVGVIRKETVENAITVFKALMTHSVHAWSSIKRTVKEEAPRLDLLKIIDKYIKKEGEVFEIHYTEQIQNGQKVAEAILSDIGANGGTTATKQALSKSLKALGFSESRDNKGKKYKISAKKYEEALAELRR